MRTHCRTAGPSFRGERVIDTFSPFTFCLRKLKHGGSCGRFRRLVKLGFRVQRAEQIGIPELQQ